MLREFSIAGVLISPMVLCAFIAAGLTAVTNFLLQRSLLKHLLPNRSWLGVSLFICYIAATVAFLDGELR
ncbi:DUF1656 domain-containing protein [Pseudomonas putida]|uniref:DUF1656 domain-containing protein n=1 Tax=Pseudomonas putida TaxID=303 RepID=A0A6I6XMN3_PSEPU|nr:DUF1656 domain-containing protein [Pseudomonas putida]